MNRRPVHLVVRELREHRGLSRRDAAERLIAQWGATNLSPETVQSRWAAWESGHSRIPADTIPDLAIVLRVPIARLYDEVLAPETIVELVREAVGAPDADQPQAA